MSLFIAIESRVLRNFVSVRTVEKLRWHCSFLSPIRICIIAYRASTLLKCPDKRLRTSLCGFAPNFWSLFVQWYLTGLVVSVPLTVAFSLSTIHYNLLWPMGRETQLTFSHNWACAEILICHCTIVTFRCNHVMRFVISDCQNLAPSWQNQQNGMCTQRKLRSAWASAQSDQSLCCLHEESLGP